MVGDRLRVETFLLCRHLETVNDQFYILGGGWGKVGFLSFPGYISFSVAIQLLVPFTETNQALNFDVTLENQNGANVLPGPMQPQVTVGRPPDLVRGEEQAVNFPLVLEGIEIPGSGTYVLRLLLSDHELARTSFLAIAVRPGIQVDS